MPLPGLELLFQSVTNVLRNADDALVPVIHWKIISNGFKCVGKGEQANGKKREVLPAGWNDDENVYVLRYVQTDTNKYFLLKIMKVDETMMVNFTREEDEKTASTTFDTSDYSTENLQDYDSAFTNLEEFVRKLKREILNEFLQKQKTTESSQRSMPRSSLLEDDPLRLSGHGGPSRSSRSGHQPEWVDPEGPFSVGHGDLDPLGRMGGGMFMDPRRFEPRFGMDPNSGLPARLPRGAIPPGARFDPFGPPGASRPSPDPDHLRPPDYDDMFM